MPSRQFAKYYLVLSIISKIPISTLMALISYYLISIVGPEYIIPRFSNAQNAEIFLTSAIYFPLIYSGRSGPVVPTFNVSLSSLQMHCYSWQQMYLVSPQFHCSAAKTSVNSILTFYNFATELTLKGPEEERLVPNAMVPWY